MLGLFHMDAGPSLNENQQRDKLKSRVTILRNPTAWATAHGFWAPSRNNNNSIVRVSVSQQSNNMDRYTEPK